MVELGEPQKKKFPPGVFGNDAEREWLNTAFIIVVPMLLFNYIVYPGMLSGIENLLIKYPYLNIFLRAMFWQLVILFTLLAVGLCFFPKVPFREKFALRGWKEFDPVIIFVMALLIQPVIWIVYFISKVFLEKYGIETQIPDIIRIARTISLPGFILLAVAAVIVAPVVEELIFRRIFFEFFTRLMGGAFSLIFTSLLFALVHCTLVQFAALFLLGVAFQLVYLRRRSLYPAILFHMTHNACAFLMILYCRITSLDLPI